MPSPPFPGFIVSVVLELSLRFHMVLLFFGVLSISRIAVHICVCSLVFWGPLYFQICCAHLCMFCLFCGSSLFSELLCTYVCDQRDLIIATHECQIFDGQIHIQLPWLQPSSMYLSLKLKCGDTRINEKSISTFWKWKSKHMELTLTSMFERFWVPAASSKYWNYQHSNRLLWLWKCYFKSAKNCKTFNHPAKMCGRNQELKLAIKIWVGSWDEEF